MNLFVLLVLFISIIGQSNGHVRRTKKGDFSDGVQPLLKNGGAVNPHLLNIEKQEIRRLKDEIMGRNHGSKTVRGRKKKLYNSLS
mmetsp:Transcript_33199/g.38435  ORF Transcript_33199/g.38435 Transcript_33199/m.38435 type:complete len:85 (-) Transcript_33199:522-776(-)